MFGNVLWFVVFSAYGIAATPMRDHVLMRSCVMLWLRISSQLLHRMISLLLST